MKIGRYTLIAGIVLLAACSDEPSAPPPPSIDANETAVTSVFNCSGDDGSLAFTVRTMGDDLALWLPFEFGRPYLVLEQVRAASGTRYETEDVMVWLHGGEAMLEVDGTSFKACALDTFASVWEHAKLSGVDFRATGNEPGWVLEISERTSIYLNYDYGQSLIETTSSEPVDDPVTRRSTFSSVADGRDVTIRISAAKCVDTMNGHEFESTVVVNIDERELRGCGRALH